MSHVKTRLLRRVTVNRRHSRASTASCQRPVTSGYTGTDNRVARVDSEGRECMRSMIDRVIAALADRYTIMEELGPLRASGNRQF